MWPIHWWRCLPGLALRASHHLPRLCIRPRWHFDIDGSTFRRVLRRVPCNAYSPVHPLTCWPSCPDCPLLLHFLSLDTCCPSTLSSPGSTWNMHLDHLSWFLPRWRWAHLLSPPPAHPSCYCPDVHCALASGPEMFRSSSVTRPHHLLIVIQTSLQHR